eukprot:4469168-Alexandrium_andersonii.AAC.1
MLAGCPGQRMQPPPGFNAACGPLSPTRRPRPPLEGHAKSRITQATPRDPRCEARGWLAGHNRRRLRAA